MINARNRNWVLSARTAGVCRCGPLFVPGGEWDDVAKPGKRDIADGWDGSSPTAPKSEIPGPQAAELARNPGPNSIVTTQFPTPSREFNLV